MSDSEKSDKVMEHKRERRIVKQLLTSGREDEDLPDPKEFGNPWKMAKDGRQWFGDLNPARLSRELRK